MLQQNRRGQGIHLWLAAAGRAALFPDGSEGPGGAHALVPELERQTGPPGDRGGHLPRGRSTLLLGAFRRQRKAHDDPDRLVQRGELEQPGHGQTLPGSAHQGVERGGEGLSFIAEGKTDTDLAPVDSQNATGFGNQCYCAIVAKNSLLFFVRFMRSSRNSIDSTGGMSARKFRSRYTRLSSSLSIKSSSLRVEVRWMSMAG